MYINNNYYITKGELKVLTVKKWLGCRMKHLKTYAIL